MKRVVVVQQSECTQSLCFPLNRMIDPAQWTAFTLSDWQPMQAIKLWRARYHCVGTTRIALKCHRRCAAVGCGAVPFGLIMGPRSAKPRGRAPVRAPAAYQFLCRVAR